MANINHPSFLLLLASLLATLNNLCLALDEERQVYIVYMGALPDAEIQYLPESHHISILKSALQNCSVEESFVYSYKRSFNGFVAKLTYQEQQKIASMEGVVSVFPSEMQQLHTTRSWDFLSFPVTVKRDPIVESNVIVGMLDTGVWPESESFNDEGLGPPPKKWRGICQTEGNFTCNNKLIGARYYKLLEATLDTARDHDGHGSHTASTVAGREVKGASLFGLAEGNARGGVPSARIAVYRICTDKGCADSSILAAFDDAIADGVDIISVSIGYPFAKNYSADSLAIGAFHAMQKGILTSQSAGNSGPGAGSIQSVAPWVFTVAASSMDRRIVTKAIIGDGTAFLGRAINTFNSTKVVPLIHATNASTSCDSPSSASSCLCLDKKLVEGKIVFCDQFQYELPNTDGSFSAGALGQITGVSGKADFSFPYPLPTTAVDPTDGNKIVSYMNTTKEPQVQILKSESIDDSMAPVVASFSSRGPNSISNNILKPDVTAPGVDIIAAFSPIAHLTDEIGDKRSVQYSILSGTSMACPHVSGAAAYVKSFHPEWSPAAIKSALMTTASPLNSSKNRDAEFAYGAGQINAVKAIDPGLVYDIQKEDYFQFLCGEGYTARNISLISGTNVTCAKEDAKKAKDLNYPSLALPVPCNKQFSSNFTRLVTNVGVPKSMYKAKIDGDTRLRITANPDNLSFESLNETKSFVVTISGSNLPDNSTLSTSLVWSDGVRSVRSPIVVFCM